MQRFERLRDGSKGWYVNNATRPDTCWQMAVACCLQIEPAAIPDPRFDKRRAAGGDPAEIDAEAQRDFARWLAGRGLGQVVHRDEMPTHLRRWIGIIEIPGWWTSHCMVMRHDAVLFDPVTATARAWLREQLIDAQLRGSLPPIDFEPPRSPREWSPAQVTCGVSFENVDREKGKKWRNK